ncbi:MAG TPA: hypothetical protein VGX78_08735 [Pirellulales bacterium]|nr:hypothetical protein [Pirellulales bacterium]
MRELGRNLQRLGLCLPPLAVVLQLFDQIGTGKMLVVLAFSVSLFGIGRIVEAYGGIRR